MGIPSTIGIEACVNILKGQTMTRREIRQAFDETEELYDDSDAGHQEAKQSLSDRLDISIAEIEQAIY